MWFFSALMEFHLRLLVLKNEEKACFLGALCPIRCPAGQSAVGFCSSGSCGAGRCYSKTTSCQEPIKIPVCSNDSAETLLASPSDPAHHRLAYVDHIHPEHKAANNSQYVAFCNGIHLPISSTMWFFSALEELQLRFLVLKAVILIMLASKELSVRLDALQDSLSLGSYSPPFGVFGSYPSGTQCNEQLAMCLPY
ncbi:hypothetical protein B9Z55_025469 [Caenorhabditis nigoni]|uniref:EB domain-containing protein n=1 Tax=Caenorhabditis nigoni TaxID=1611254 RepID=A0A2G5SYR7_9PELO|nr:hypothetical protein B9Z55_025469 [Caenorhabditis nigoni]